VMKFDQDLVHWDCALNHILNHAVFRAFYIQFEQVGLASAQTANQDRFPAITVQEWPIFSG
jgi:hypothetical protein